MEYVFIAKVTSSMSMLELKHMLSNTVGTAGCTTFGWELLQQAKAKVVRIVTTTFMYFIILSFLTLLSNFVT